MSGPRHDVGNVDHVAVIGGGIIGLCVAHYLRAAGVDVVVLERDRVGSGASRGNAGEICPGLATPLAAPGVVGEALRGLRRGGSPLQLRPQANPAVARFLLGFAWSARQAPFSRGVRALAQLGADAVSLYRELDAGGVEMHRNDRPYLYVYGSRDAAAAGRQSLERALGEPSDLFGPVLDADELRRREPCLAGDVAGYEVNGQMTVNPSVLVDSLAAHLRAAGVVIREGARATAIASRPHGAIVHTSAGAVPADAVVLASGIWSAPLAATVGTRLPIFPGKGYSFNVPVEHRPEHLLAIEAAHVHMAPLGETTRITGMIDFDAQHDRFDRRQIETIVSAARPFIDGADWPAISAEWVGPRPMTPNGLPLIGALAGAPRVFVAAGHNMLGVTLAPSTGRAVAELITSGRASVDLEPFRPTSWRPPRRPTAAARAPAR
jgi:D-amino-acid dehydrogenase